MGKQLEKIRELNCKERLINVAELTWSLASRSGMMNSSKICLAMGFLVALLSSCWYSLIYREAQGLSNICIIYLQHVVGNSVLFISLKFMCVYL